MSDSIPSAGEMIRRLDEISKRLDDVTKRLDSQAERMEERYVAKGEYLSDRRGDERRFREIEKDLENQSSWRRQVTASGLVGALVLIAGTVVNIAIARGGI